MSQVAPPSQPISFPSRPSHSYSPSPSPTRSNSYDHSSFGTSPTSSGLAGGRTGTSPVGQHPCPHFGEFVQSLYKAWGGRAEGRRFSA
ncbi:hypothetical protein IAT38_008442 [Cryptococcus sp. DSM 104549]